MKKKVPIWLKYFSVMAALCIVVVIVIVSVFLTIFITNENEIISKSMSNTLSIIEMNVNNELDVIHDKTNGISIANLIDKAYQEKDKYEFRSFINELYSSKYAESSLIDALFYVDKFGNTYSVGRDMGNIDDRMLLINECKSLDGFNKDKRIYRHGYVDKNKDSIILCSNVVQVTDNFQTVNLGTTIVCIDPKKLYDKCVPFLEYGEIIVITDAEGTIILSSDEKLIGKKRSDCQEINQKSTVVRRMSTNNNLEFSCYLTEVITRERINAIFISVLIYVIVLLVAIAVILFFFSKHIGRSIAEILKYVTVTKYGELQVDSKYEDNTEIGEIIVKLKELAGEIKDRIDENDKMKKNLQEISFKSYESQLNPHFLNNTMQLIQVMGLNGDNNGIFTVTSCLGEMLRYNLSGSVEVLIEDEIKMVENYCKILKLRFGDRFNYSINIPEEIKKCVSLKFLIQPFFENAVKHGFHKQYENMEIIIFGQEMNNEIVLVVKDNGDGISKEKLEKIKENLRTVTRTGESGIGILNVHERIRILYGENYGVDVFSSGNGTQILIHVPKKTQRERDENDI